MVSARSVSLRSELAVTALERGYLLLYIVSK
jgi:hypothetical protein